MKQFLILIIAVCSCFYASAQLSWEELALYGLIMQYRAAKGLSKIPVSPSLTAVAQTHVRDLADNKPDIGACNAHSWSDKGAWKACCYTPDHAKGALMWSKPKELTNYKGMGFEIACGSNGCCAGFIMTPDFALRAWQGSPGHNSVILNTDVWKHYR